MPTPAGYRTLVELVAAFTAPDPSMLSDAELLDAQRALASVRQRVDGHAASVAAQIAHRSRRELGYTGLAQRHGARTPEALVQIITGASAREARTLVRVGTLVAETPLPSGSDGPTFEPSTPPLEPASAWMAPVVAAIREGRLTLEAADSIRTGLGTPSDAITVDALRAAATRLVDDAEGLTIKNLAALARHLRDELDAEGVGAREEALRERRYLHLIPQSDGMTRIHGLLDPEYAALITSTIDAATSPRRGGPRFIDPVSRAHAEEVLRDPRSIEQITLDTLIELIRLGATADTGLLLGVHKPAVRVHVTELDLARRAGAARIEGQNATVSIATADRHACETGIVPILFDTDGQVLNVGREHRLFTTRQRIGLTARDGGCRFPDCDRPPGWCEAHHTTPWQRGGNTDIRDGILLCRHHHLLVHNNGWKITRRGADYYAVPPRALDPAQTPIPAPPRHSLTRQTA